MRAVLVSLPHFELSIDKDWKTADDNRMLFSVLRFWPASNGADTRLDDLSQPYLTPQTDHVSELLFGGIPAQYTKSTPPRNTHKHALHCAFWLPSCADSPCKGNPLAPMDKVGDTPCCPSAPGSSVGTRARSSAGTPSASIHTRNSSAQKSGLGEGHSSCNLSHLCVALLWIK